MRTAIGTAALLAGLLCGAPAEAAVMLSADTFAPGVLKATVPAERPTIVDDAAVPPSASVAEPATWTMLGAGFGLVGVGLGRRSRRKGLTQAV